MFQPLIPMQIHVFSDLAIKTILTAGLVLGVAVRIKNKRKQTYTISKFIGKTGDK